MIRGVHHLAISTPDLERFVDHYQRWFGFERAARKAAGSPATTA
ncbi:VOC family protein [Novosphingobium resinovorum]